MTVLSMYDISSRILRPPRRALDVGTEKWVEIESDLPKKPLVEGYLSLPLQLQLASFDLTVGYIHVFEGYRNDPVSISLNRSPEPRLRFLPYTTILPLDLEEDHVGYWRLAPGQMYSVTFNETVNIPADLAAYVYPCSNVVHSGYILHSGVWDPGHTGQRAVTMYSPTQPLLIAQDSSIAQVVFYTLASSIREKDLYGGSYQNEVAQYQALHNI